MKIAASSAFQIAFFWFTTILSLPAYADVAFDYDGDEKADLAVRRNSNSYQYISKSSDFDIARIAFGRLPGDVPVSGDFDGDGIYDIAIRRPADQTWYIINSSGIDALTNHQDGISRVRFGRHMADIPVPADYDGDGKTDLAVRRPSNQYWYIRNSSGVDAISGNSDGITRIRFGLQATDIPAPADYDGDGKADLAVRRPSDHLWFIRNSTGVDTLTGHADGISRVLFGRQSTDIPVVADYDGDGKTDIAVRRPATYQWYIQNSSGIDAATGHPDGISRIAFGRDSHDIPVIADYDGDGKADIAVRRPSNYTWYVRNSSGTDLRTSNSDGITRARFGLQAQDIPLAQPPHLIWLVSDIDNDGLSNQQEMALGTDITNADSDNDGLTDGEEVNEHQTDPLNADSDGDGRNDGDEVEAGTDPNSAENSGPFNFSEARLTDLKAYRLQGAPHTDGQLQHAWSVWHFVQNDYAILHQAENISQSHYRYEIVNDNQLILRPVNGLYTDTTSCFDVRRSSWWEARLEEFGEGVFDAISDACWLGLFPNDSVSLSYGEVESRWELQQSDAQTFTVSSTYVTNSILELPEAVLGFWPDDVPTSIETQTPFAPYELVYVSEDTMPELLSSDLDGSWIMPMEFSGNPSDDNKSLSAGFLHDRVVIAGQQASSLHSKVNFDVNISGSSFSLQQNDQKLIYTPVKQLSDNFLVLVEHYRDEVLYDVYVSMMVKVNTLDGSFLSSPSTELPQAYVTLLHPNSIYDEQIPLSDLQAYHLKTNGNATSINYKPQWRERAFTFDSDNSWQVLNDNELIIEYPYSQGLIRRHWQVIDVTSSGQAIVLEYQMNARGQFEGDEFVVTSQRFIERPRLNVVSKIDLSQYGDIWNYTDFDRDGLSNQFEAVLGTDIEKPDTDNDGYTDYEEWWSGTDPTDSQSVPLLIGDIEFADENLRNCLLSNHESEDMASTVQFVHCRFSSITSLSGIENLSHLEFLTLSGNATSDLAPLSTLTKLRGLRLEYNNMQSLAGIEKLTSLEKLYLANNNIQDLSLLAEFSQLDYLDLSSNGLSDLSSISGLVNLTGLNLNDNNIIDVSPLGHLATLRKLYLGSNQVVSVAPLNSLTGLTTLNLYNNSSAVCDEIDDLTRELYPVDITRPDHCPAGVAVDESLVTDAALLACIQSYSIQWIKELTQLECDGMNIASVDGLEQFYALHSLSLWSNDLTSINVLSALTALSYLELDYNEIADISPLAELTNLEDLRLSRNEIVDIVPLLALHKLTNLDLRRNKIENVSASGQLLNLQLLDLSGNAVKEISWLSAFSKLETLELSDNQIVNVEALSSLELLGTLELNNNQISDISALQSLSRLNVLELAGNQIQDISPIASLRWINSLYINNNDVPDISPLARYFRLNYLDISDNPIEDSSAVEAMNGLRELSMARIAAQPDWTIINGFENLRYLDISGLNISNISGFNPSSTSFIGLLMNDNQITDVSGLNSLTNLGRLSVNNNQIADITQLSELSRLYELNIANNNVSDIAMIGDFTRLRVLNLGENPITDISPLGEMTGLSTLDISGLALDDLSVLSPLTGLFRLRANNNNLSDLSSVVGLTGLAVLYTNDNQISDVTAVSQLANLGVLSLNDNVITDVNPLNALSDNLVILSLATNQIADVTPFYEMQSLSLLDVSNNPDIGCDALAQLQEQLSSTEVRSALECQN